MLKSHFLYIIIGLLGVIIIMFLLWPSKPIQEPVKPTADPSLVARQAELLRKMRADSLAYADTVKVLNDKIAKLEARKVPRTVFKQATSNELDSVKVDLLGEMVIYSDTSYCMDLNEARVIFADASNLPVLDSINDLQATLIEKMGSDKVTTWNSFNSLISLEQERTTQQKELAAYYEDLTETYKNELKKERRKGKLFKILIPVAFLGGLLIQ